MKCVCKTKMIETDRIEIVGREKIFMECPECGRKHTYFIAKVKRKYSKKYHAPADNE